jgi:hypothetical protein
MANGEHQDLIGECQALWFLHGSSCARRVVTGALFMQCIGAIPS